MEQVPIKIQLLIWTLHANHAPLSAVLVLDIYAHQRSNEPVQYVNLVSIKNPLLIRILPVNLVLPHARVVLNFLLVQEQQIEHV